MRTFLFLMCALGIPWASWARANQSSWDNLSKLESGQKIQVVEMNSKKDSGTFLNVSETAISLRETVREQTIQRQDVRSLELMEHGHRLRNALISAGVGAGAGAAIGTVGHREGSLQNPNGTFIKPGQGAAIGAVIGLIGGAVVGVLLPSHKTIYRVKPQ
jgi:hypothetical protein